MLSLASHSATCSIDSPSRPLMTSRKSTFLGVAEAAQVSNWLVYAEGVREHIEAARKSQTSGKARERKRGAAASPASMATDLELARAGTLNSSPASTNSLRPTRHLPTSWPAPKPTGTACGPRSPRPRTT